MNGHQYCEQESAEQRLLNEENSDTFTLEDKGVMYLVPALSSHSHSTTTSSIALKKRRLNASNASGGKIVANPAANLKGRRRRITRKKTAMKKLWGMRKGKRGRR
jgi:cytosine/adenosine deaminase-related metal-dependent hydrolase